MTHTVRIAGAFVVLAAMSPGACARPDGFIDRDADPASTVPADASPGDARETGVAALPDARSSALSLLAVRPGHGSFAGGSTVTLRGSNFTDGLTVRFGGSLVQPRDLTLTDANRLVVKTPSGMPGTVDVTVESATARSVLAQGYTYDAFYADPASGSIAGGTRIALHGQGTGWSSASTVTVDSQACRDVRIVSPNEIDCTVPAHAQGAVPITVTTGSDAVLVGDAFTFYESEDSSGGFSGGPIHGSVNINVIDAQTGNAIPQAFVYLGTDPLVLPPSSGLTNTRGQVTLSGDDLRGPLTVTVTAHCHASSTFQLIDSRDGTVLLMPWLGMVPGVDCGPPPSGDPGPAPQPTYAAQIDGELVWDGPNEFTPNAWQNIPAPHANERRVTYVMTTTSSIYGGNPDPGGGGTVLEHVASDYVGRGYPYTIVARPSGLAVYAVAGLERMDTMPAQFTPYVMGVARGVLASPRAQLTHVDVNMNIPLDHETVVALTNPPTATGGKPDTFRVETWTDLGGEGVIPRPDVTVIGRSAADPYRLVAQPAFSDTLADARTIVRATYGSGTVFGDPRSVVLVTGITSPDETVNIAHWVGIPHLADPIDGGTLGTARTVTLTQSGEDPDMFLSVLSRAGSSCSQGYFLGDVVFWQQYFPGATRTMNFPDLSAIPSLTDVPRGIYTFSVCGFRVAGFDYGDISYRFLWPGNSYWTAYATTTYTLAR